MMTVGAMHSFLTLCIPNAVVPCLVQASTFMHKYPHVAGQQLTPTTPVARLILCMEPGQG